MIVNPVIFGGGDTPPKEKEVLSFMIIYNPSTNVIDDVITGGQNYESQS